MSWVVAGLVGAPLLWVLALLLRRMRGGEYQRMWGPFERALRTGRTPREVDAEEWAAFVEARRRGHRRAVWLQSLAVTVYVLTTVGFGGSLDVIRFAGVVLAVFTIAVLAIRLHRIERLAVAPVSRL